MGKEGNVDWLGFNGKLLLCALPFMFVGHAVNSLKNEIPKEKYLHVERKLKQLRKPAVKSIQSDDGDVIDCIDIYKQPAFDHPLLQNHTIQMKPSFSFSKEESSSSLNFPEISQVWRRKGRCPKGTIPIRRVKKSDLLDAPSVETFGKKVGNFMYHPNNATELEVNGNTTSTAIAVLYTHGNYSGANGYINVWRPMVEYRDSSSGQMWLRGGTVGSYTSLEAGWIVYPTLYRSLLSRVFIYWTSDGYKSTGCFDLLCPGFVQVSEEVVFGGAFDLTSKSYGSQYIVPLKIYLDAETGNWWLRCNFNTDIGYWPSEILKNSLKRASMVEWGGEVMSSKSERPHTYTQMGSGRFAENGYRVASFVNGYQVLDQGSKEWKYPASVKTYQNQVNCYDGMNVEKSLKSESQFYFGGPGLNPMCP